MSGGWGLQMQAVCPGRSLILCLHHEKANSWTSCLRNHWCLLWCRLWAGVTVKGQCELDATCIQEVRIHKCGPFFISNVSPRAGDILLPDIHPRSHPLCTYATTLPIPSPSTTTTTKIKSPSSLCRTVADPRHCSRAPVEAASACAMRRCYGWGIDKY